MTTNQNPESSANKRDQPEPQDEVVKFVEKGFQEVIGVIRGANSLPQGAARDMYLSYPEYNRAIREASDRVLGLMSKIMKAQGVSGNIERRSADEQLDMVVECGDDIFERLSLNIDQKLRSLKEPNALQVMMVESKAENATKTSPANATASGGSWNIKRRVDRASSARLLTMANIERPQVNFKVPVDNSAHVPFIPRLKEKPNSSKPLAILPEYDESGNVYAYLHPYEFELEAFEPAEAQLQRKTPAKTWPSISDTAFVYINTLPKLQTALVELQQTQEIAVDVEHHSYRSFQGITCLLQMSTRNKDYVFDTLALREELHLLNLVLTDARIVKIFHGADLDIEWLQRDLSLYVVNLFDTYQAAKELNLPRLSLAYLLKDVEHIDADKTFQLADWRMRPLPDELINYARQDTRYLIHIYEHLTNRLLDLPHGQRALELVYKRSTDVCRKRYAKPQIHEQSHLELMRKAKRVFDNQQLYALRELYRWRDHTARLEDESYGYVLPNHMLLHIAESRPREMQGILALCNPIPPPVRQQLLVLHKIVLRAREQPLVKIITPVQNPARDITARSWSYHNKLDCPHDLSNIEDIDDSLPTLIDIETGGPGRLAEETAKLRLNPPAPLISESTALTFYNGSHLVVQNQRHRAARQAEVDFITMPFRRYTQMLPILEQEQLAEEQRLQQELKKRQLCPSELPVEQKHNVSLANTNEIADNVKALSLREIKHPPLKVAAKREQSEDNATPPKRVKIEQTTPTTSRPKQEADDNDDDGDGDDDDTDTNLNVSSAPAQMSTPKTPVNSADSDTLRRKQGSSSGKNNRKFKAKARLHPQSSDRVPSILPGNANKNNSFDYSQVNFKQFKGGAQRAQGAEIKQKNHGTSKPSAAQNKKFNKLFTFSNVKSKK